MSPGAMAAPPVALRRERHSLEEVRAHASAVRGVDAAGDAGGTRDAAEASASAERGGLGAVVDADVVLAAAAVAGVRPAAGVAALGGGRVGVAGVAQRDGHRAVAGR